MKVLFDHTLFYQVYGGASKYFAMMINSLPRDSWATTALWSCNEYVHAKHLFQTYPKKFRGQNRILSLFNRPYTCYRVGKRQYDVMHQTDFDHYFYKQLGNKPLVVTYHDANYLTYFPQPDRVALQRVALQRADAIVAVSENTKHDLLKYFDVDEEKVHVIYHGIELFDTQEHLLDPIGQPYILYVGVRASYKNFERFVQAFSAYHQLFPEVKVVCTSDPFTTAEHQMFHQLGIEESMIHISADEQIMRALYENALFFIYPSIYEGFGMPILEAWANHCPVALSKASCFPEICQEAGEYFEPTDTDSMLAVMTKLTEDEDRRKDLTAIGDQRVKLFSWKRCADEHMKVYEALL
ncbi:glycosyltransferase family 4 protein [Prevotella sp. AGR2160]|uniref:glycosyltransferase family 4 protein n=1 Tax=Prevotella sp. AGR2160 TaxID=1280674 RepID=UPI000415932F|nr:glycosyltransferase family 1 protein [Prevotella sp. AGR2160]